jgi:NADP-dependent 3-hydroxy acid dehydrogenase YdfG
MMSSAPEDTRIEPDAIADAFAYLVSQPKSAWTHELDVRPFSEKFS